VNSCVGGPASSAYAYAPDHVRTPRHKLARTMH